MVSKGKKSRKINYAYMLHISKPSLSYNESLQIKPAPAQDIFHMLSTTQQQNPKVMIRNTLFNMELLKSTAQTELRGGKLKYITQKNDIATRIHTSH